MQSICRYEVFYFFRSHKFSFDLVSSLRIDAASEEVDVNVTFGFIAAAYIKHSKVHTLYVSHFRPLPIVPEYPDSPSMLRLLIIVFAMIYWLRIKDLDLSAIERGV